MCLAIPVKIFEISQENGVRAGSVSFGGSVTQVCLDLLPEAQVGDYVVLHAGFAISRVDSEEAERTYQDLESIGFLVGDLTAAPG
ncbi:MAG: HypC/HybG/HupF family hydrogenase formation chaperone [Terriglobia bacterium]